MKITTATADKMQGLLQKFFDANAISDNIAYWFGFNYYNNIESLYHAKWAHAFPGDAFADGLSTFMLKCDVRPVRRGLEGHTDGFTSLPEAFEANRAMIEDLESAIRDLIETAEFNEDAQVKLYGEELQLTIMNYVKQAKEWEHISKATSPYDMDLHFAQYTHFI